MRFREFLRIFKLFQFIWENVLELSWAWSTATGHPCPAAHVSPGNKGSIGMMGHATLDAYTVPEKSTDVPPWSCRMKTRTLRTWAPRCPRFPLCWSRVHSSTSKSTEEFLLMSDEHPQCLSFSLIFSLGQGHTQSRLTLNSLCSPWWLWTLGWP